ncbi:Non-hem dioxygenase N-terminal domain [Dillenia turbinata]|uniref:Non-hem dioxygenase N-terminal domain n=1 Tax=Dillenia turbinata TaxID=194707 RepID=A0AAN8UN72_9MAGN
METQVETRLGGSLPVPCVQELAKEPLITVPPRYICADQEPPHPVNTTLLPQIPIIDMQRLLSGEAMDYELDKLHCACKEWGFFQVINHELSTSLIEKVKHEMQEFFKLPMEEKQKYWQLPGDLEGFGQAFVVSDEQKLDWGDLFFIFTLPVHMRKSSLFSSLPESFREAIHSYSIAVRDVAMKILESMAKALKMEMSYMRELFEEGHQSMRMNYYPPCPQPEKVIGLRPHSDAVGLTILLQVNEMEGLQVRKDGVWVPINPLPNAFVVNIGDILEMVTNGAYRSIEHRATINPVKERLSIATFYSPKLDVEMGPAPSLIIPQNPALFKRIITGDYFKGLFARELHGKSYLDAMRI